MISNIAQNGKAVVKAIACNELNPPLIISVIAIKPMKTHHNILCNLGVLSFPPAVMVSITKAPESMEVIKNTQINTTAMMEVT